MKERDTTYKVKETETFLDAPSKEYILRIKDLPLEDQPRQKLIKHGPETLSPQELLSVILNVGSRGEGVVEMSNRILREYGEKSIFAERDAVKLSKDLNIPLIKACQIIACGELGKRFFEKNAAGFTLIRTAKDVFEYLHDMRKLPKEHLRGLYLNSHNRIIHDEVISIGTINTNIVHPREVFRPAIEYCAVAIVLAHNHPSGSTVPSAEDIQITEQIIKAGKVVGIHLLDHVIITRDSFSSIKSKY